MLALLAGQRLLDVGDADAVPGCCSRHKGVCGCACCDGTALSATCRARMPECGSDAENRADATPSKSFSGEVVGVMDGDTIEVMRGGGAVRIRLADIDCPEKGQPFGHRAKEFTSSLAFRKTVTVKARAIDRYGRTVADVFLPAGVFLNAEILRAGLAWWYRDYSKDERLGAIEAEARAARRGLWSEADPVPPWVFRRRR